MSLFWQGLRPATTEARFDTFVADLFNDCLGNIHNFSDDSRLERAGFLFAIFALRLTLTTWVALRSRRSINAVPVDIQERVYKMFVTALRSNPPATAGLVSLHRDSGIPAWLPNEDAQYDYRLLRDADLIFPVGIDSFGGIRYSPRIRLIAPAGNFRLETIGENWTGKRSKVRLMPDNEPAFGPLKITPEMLKMVYRERLVG